MKKIIIILILITLTISLGYTQTQTESNRFVEKNFYKDYASGCLIERIDATTFNYEDEDIRFYIVPYCLYFTMRIYNKSNQEMICRWERALFVIQEKSYNILYVDNAAQRHDAIFAPRYIAPHSYNEYWIDAPVTFIYQRKKVKKYGPTIVRLLIPIEVNGKEIMYDFKYRVYYWDRKNENRVHETHNGKIVIRNHK